MSYLDKFINRMMAQRICLDLAPAIIRDIEGPVLEFGLGHGRTYDHLLQNFPDRDVYVFEKVVSPNVFVRPADALLFEGDIHDTLKTALKRLPRKAAMAHSDLGLKDRDGAVPIVASIIQYLPSLIAPGGIYVSNTDISLVNGRIPSAFEPLDLAQVPEGQYFIYRVGA
jgi:S-adenosyl-L-methionine methyltransferase